ncbi:MAG: lipopolysaccharide transport system ATP-binding protein [Candidatus Hydrogenedentes bacterium]|nr:lipopolysaccharide transport system ATP-binding protein [Candidatus Hydrogenedentota bacterium]
MPWRERIARGLAYRYVRAHCGWYGRALCERIDGILRFEETAVNLATGEQEEHALPGFAKYRADGHGRYMLGRYLYAIKYVRGKDVLDAGCGLGWGAHLISDYPKMLLAVDPDAGAIAFARRTWQDPRVTFETASLAQVAGEACFDAVLAFEVIEHMPYEEGAAFLGDCARLLRPRGALVLSSHFAAARAEAETMERMNRFHRHIYTRAEIERLLSETGFGRRRFLGDFMAVAYRGRAHG